MARCPAHQDRNASLSVNEDHEKILLKCHTGCSTESVVGALGLELKDLYYEQRQAEEPEAIYDYVEADGELVFQVLRFPGKRFQQRRPDGAGDWIWSVKDVQKPLYRLPELREAVAAGRRVYFVEGEKDVEAIRKAGSTATTKAGGSTSKWEDWYTEEFAGAHVFIVADRDEPGRKVARRVLQHLEPVVASVRILEAAEGKDAHDHLSSGLTLKDLVPLETAEEAQPVSVADGIKLTRIADVAPRDVEWVDGFQDWIPYGGITLLMGMPGANKSTLACMIAAKITREGNAAVFVASEDSVDSVLRPRLSVAGADLDLCHDACLMADGFENPVILPTHVPELERAVRTTGARLLVVDPITAHLGATDGNNDPMVRSAISPLARMAERNRLAVLVLMHMNKARAQDPMVRAGGSIGLPGIARSGLLMGQNPDYPDDTGLRVVASFKNSWGPIPASQQYRLEDVPVEGLKRAPIRLRAWGTTYHTARQLLKRDATNRREE